jgi:hypothetical protein
MILALCFFNGQIIDGSKPAKHKPVFIELPIFIAIRAVPLPGVVVPFIGEANSNPVPIEGPELLDETVIEFLGPLPLKESDDLGPAVEKLRTVSPKAVLGVPVCKLLRVSRIPLILD